MESCVQNYRETLSLKSSDHSIAQQMTKIPNKVLQGLSFNRCLINLFNINR